MKVILIHNLDKIGNFGEVKEVSDGYARNFLIPKKFAVPFTEENLRYVESLKKNIEFKREREQNYINELKHTLEKTSITVTVSTGKDNKIYGSVTKEDIVEAIQQQIGVKIDKHSIKIDFPIKELGVHSVDIVLHSDKFPEISTVAKTKVWVVGR
ncbi:MAG: 50S ribosomal protein L9 [Endomicrobia bacterium]|nr:50S ribosomal protein L9 [Endomicrobiia bacterium]MCX7941432.1 50S ribosomal protein L9 [Endomicrobiia bacterium]MDW8055464.1 50S ribosomal protein L9 [Elusimicrobiota bacterium]